MAVSSASVGGSTLSDSLGAGGGGGTSFAGGDIRSFTGTPEVVLNLTSTNIYGMAWGDDGNKFYIVEASNDRVKMYDLSTAYDISTAGSATDLNVGGDETEPRGVAFNNDGTKMYLSGWTEQVHEYDLSTAWDISTAGASTSTSISANTTTLFNITFNADGTKMFASDGGSDDIDEYALSTAFDTTTATFTTNSVGPGTLAQTAGHTCNADGTIFLVLDEVEDVIWQLDCSTGFDVSTGTVGRGMLWTGFSGLSVSNPSGLLLAPDNSALYISDTSTDDVYKIPLS